MGLNGAQKRERSIYLENNLKITECSQRKPYVFISYASDNWEAVFKSAVVPLQRQYGLRVYADKAFDKVNDKWIVPMLRNVRGADVMMVFISQSYIESYACFLELLTAVNNKKQIVFVSLEEQLHLGNTGDQPDIERGVKNEILIQGGNIVTNTNNTSNDIMRAMKSAYTSLSTLLEQDALSKYDISDAFINFFRDASINRKTIRDLEAIMSSINSVSRNVFDKSQVSGQVTEDGSGKTDRETSEIQRHQEPQTGPEPAGKAPLKHGKAESLVEKTRRPGRRTGRWKAGLIAGGTGLLVLLFLIILTVNGSSKVVTDVAYTLCTGHAGTYTGQWKGGEPNGWGIIHLDNGGVYEGEWKDGEANGQGTIKWDSGVSYEGEWKDSQRNGQGIYRGVDGTLYEGEWADDERNGLGTMIYANKDKYEGEWKNSRKDGFGTMTYADGDEYEGEWANDKINGQGTFTYSDGRVETGIWKDGKLVE